MTFLIFSCSEFKMTHQATANRWSLSSHRCTFCFPGTSVIVAARFCFLDRHTDVRTPCMKIMTTFWPWPGGQIANWFILLTAIKLKENFTFSLYWSMWKRDKILDWSTRPTQSHGRSHMSSVRPSSILKI